MCRLPAACGEGGGIDGEAMVLRRDLDLAGGQILHGVVRAVMTERQLVRPATGGEAEDLMAEADAEHRNAPDESAHGIDEVRDALGIARAVREEHAVGLPL